MTARQTFLDKLTLKWQENKFLCVGLDKSNFEFNQQIVDQTYDLVCAFKPNAAFYESNGTTGLEALKKTMSYIQQNHPDIPVILDAKRGDTGNTNEAYTEAIFDDLGADAVTVSPYLGKESLQPFLKRADKGIFVLVKTSNPGAAEFQDLEVYPESDLIGPERSHARGGRSRRGKPLYQVVAEHVASEWNTNGNLAVVAGATYPEQLLTVRKIVGDMPILVPGIGTQGGDLENTIKNGLNSKKQGLIISSSRSIIFAPDPRKAALDLHSQIQEILNHV